MNTAESLRNILSNDFCDDLRVQAIAIAEVISLVDKKGKLTAIFGNGGSAADAQHWAAELVCTYQDRCRKPFAALALTSDTSIITAWSNDIDFDTVFSRQVEAYKAFLGLAIGISTSGTSVNVLSALEKAAMNGAETILITGSSAPRCNSVNIQVYLPSSETPTIQTLTQLLYHEVCAYLEVE